MKHVNKIVFYLFLLLFFNMASLVAQTVKRLSTMGETWVRSLGREDLLEKEMTIHSIKYSRALSYLEIQSLP